MIVTHCLRNWIGVLCAHEGKWNMPRNQLRRENINFQKSEYWIPRTNEKKAANMRMKKMKINNDDDFAIACDMIIQHWKRGTKKPALAKCRKSYMYMSYAFCLWFII